ncbi:MAG: D-beta-D-heptose 7-phosphate kinase/D-beta-D-heptose 1-phosphate adenosyltransferase, partial [Halioglobus sp.]
MIRLQTKIESVTMKLNMPRFDRASVLVVGDIMLDRYWQGPTS